MAFNFLLDLRNVWMVFAVSYFHDFDGLGERERERKEVKTLKPIPAHPHLCVLL